jgi:hypothetical protein
MIYATDTKEVGMNIDNEVSWNRVSHELVDVTTSEIDLSAGEYFELSIDSDTTLSFINSPINVFTFSIKITSVGEHIVGFPTSISWAKAKAPTLTKDSSDILTFVTFDGGVNWNGLVVAQDLRKTQ